MIGPHVHMGPIKILVISADKIDTLPHLVHLPVILRFHHQLNDNCYLPKDPNNLHQPNLISDHQLQHSYFNNTIFFLLCKGTSWEESEEVLLLLHPVFITALNHQLSCVSPWLEKHALTIAIKGV